MSFIEELWSKKGKQHYIKVYRSLLGLHNVNTFSELKDHPLFINCVLNTVDVFKTQTGKLIVELFVYNENNDEIGFVINNYNKNDDDEFEDFITKNKTIFKPTVVGQVPGIGRLSVEDLFYTKEQIEGKLKEFLEQNYFTISASTKDKLENWLRNEF